MPETLLQNNDACDISIIIRALIQYKDAILPE